MSPLLDRQRQGVRLGSIRIGIRVVKNGKTVPEKLTTFRLTSPDRAKVDAAAALYGGEVGPWSPRENAAGQWEVVTLVDKLPVRVPPGEPVQQNYEKWSANRQRLCDGVTERMSGKPCLCPVDLSARRLLASNGEACKPITRLNLILADLPGLGVWTLSSTGDSAADELASTAELLQRAEVLRGILLPATLRLEQREQRGSGSLHQFAVPVLDIGSSLAALEAGDYQRPAIEGRAAPAPQLPAAAEFADALAIHAAALAAASPDEIRGLKKTAADQGWLEEYVPDSNGVLEPLENALYTRFVDLGGEG